MGVSGAPAAPFRPPWGDGEEGRLATPSFLYHMYAYTSVLRRRPSNGRRRSKCPQKTKKTLQKAVYDATGPLQISRFIPDASKS